MKILPFVPQSHPTFIKPQEHLETNPYYRITKESH